MTSHKMNIISIVLATIVFQGCSHVRDYSDFDLINLAAEGKRVELSLIWTDTVFKGEDFNISTDSTVWLDPGLKIRHAIPTAHVYQVGLFNRRIGVWDGFKGFVYAGVFYGGAWFLTGDGDGKSGLQIPRAEKISIRRYGWRIVWSYYWSSGGRTRR